MYSNTILKLDLIVIIIQKYCYKYLKPDKNIDKIKKSKTIQFVLDQLNDIRKTKDFKTLKSIFTIEKKHKIKDLKDWLNTLCANNFKLFSKHFKLDVEIDMTKGYRTYVNLLSKLENNKTKVDLKKSNKQISILFNLLFCNIIVGGGKEPKPEKSPRGHHPYGGPLPVPPSPLPVLPSPLPVLPSPLPVLPRRSERLRDVVNEIMIKKAIVNSFRDASINFETSITAASKSEPGTLLKIVALMEAALQATETAQLSENITCIPQEGDLGTCWIISVIAALVYSSNFGIILEYICRNEISKLGVSELDGEDVPIKTIILTNFRMLFILQKYDQIRTHIGTKAYTMPNNFIAQFVKKIFEKDKTFFKVQREASLNPTTLTELLTWGGDFSDRQHLITNILKQGFSFTTDLIDLNTRVYNLAYVLREDGTAKSFRLLHIPLCHPEYSEYTLAYTLASYIVVARHGKVGHSVAVVEKNGKNVLCNGWCDSDTGCMVQEICGRTFSLGKFHFDIDGKFTLALAFDDSNFVSISTIENEFAVQLKKVTNVPTLLEGSSSSSSLNSSLSSLLDYY
tara:strand:+ start:361 stop:2064 length:1704 start_codon:yes stop_codon:yes gene_type:complete